MGVVCLRPLHIHLLPSPSRHKILSSWAIKVTATHGKRPYNAVDIFSHNLSQLWTNSLLYCQRRNVEGFELTLHHLRNPIFAPDMLVYDHLATRFEKPIHRLHHDIRLRYAAKHLDAHYGIYTPFGDPVLPQSIKILNTTRDDRVHITEPILLDRLPESGMKVHIGLNAITLGNGGLVVP